MATHFFANNYRNFVTCTKPTNGHIAIFDLILEEDIKIAWKFTRKLGFSRLCFKGSIWWDTYSSILDSWTFQKMNFANVISPHANFANLLLKMYQLSIHSTIFYVQNFAKLQSRRFSQGNFGMDTRSGIHESTVSLRFLCIILSSQTWGFCMDFLNHREGGLVFH